MIVYPRGPYGILSLLGGCGSVLPRTAAIGALSAAVAVALELVGAGPAISKWWRSAVLPYQLFAFIVGFVVTFRSGLRASRPAPAGLPGAKRARGPLAPSPNSAARLPVSPTHLARVARAACRPAGRPAGGASKRHPRSPRRPPLQFATPWRAVVKHVCSSRAAPAQQHCVWHAHISAPSATSRAARAGRR